MSITTIFEIAASGMSAQSVRLNTTASNLANAQSVSSSLEETYRSRHPVFSTKQTPFDELFNDGIRGLNQDVGRGVEVLGIVESDSPLVERYEPNHPMANEQGYVSYPNVNVVEQMADMISASRSFQTNVDVMDSAKKMMERLLNMGR